MTLHDRIEAAEGACRELDAEIAKLVGWERDTHLNWRRPDGKLVNGTQIPAFTKSIDSALTLVPEGCDWAAGTTVTELTFATIGFDRPVHAKTPALAICAAALKARGV